MTTTILLGVLIALAFMLGLFYCLIEIIKLLRQIRNKTEVSLFETKQVALEIKELRLASRARVGSINTNEGPQPTIVRTGRGARSKRVIAGGDPSSDQFQEQQRSLGNQEENK